MKHDKYNITKDGNRYKIEYNAIKVLKTSGKKKQKKVVTYRQDLITVLSKFNAKDKYITDFLDKYNKIIDKLKFNVSV